MTVLSDSDIIFSLSRKALGITPFSEACLTPNGYDLRVAELLLPDQDSEPRLNARSLAPAHARFLVSTVEHVSLPGDVCGSLWLRSTYARRGVLATFGKVEAGFSGTLTLSCFNASSSPLDLRAGERFCQIVFERLERRPTKLYAQRSGTYQGQQGITLARDGP